ncbi:DUF1318 domain-containing protein [Roseospira navarrensis]|uniref:DUF1318 domain-containing protein n=1 Tax=Roseospira navarrensis TaxID=140058 RepID=A0A7X1ZAT7_9PROT|nr:DUF1318 domain-containing protein [Roseospira navarrensis]MQX34977.1 DUF1318 domain-containing protein [Roseospira navarrensis]
MTPTPPTATAHRPGLRRAMLALMAGPVLALSLAAGTAPAAAQSLDQLRANGQVCERPDGLLHVLSGGPGVQQTVDQINQQRLSTYQQVARDTNTKIEQVRIISGEKLRAKYGGCP